MPISRSFGSSKKIQLFGFFIIFLVSIGCKTSFAQSTGQNYYYLKEFVSLQEFEDEDHDNDGVSNANDPFPYNPNEWLDTDGDGIGNLSDADDDNDLMPDVFELANSLHPLVADGHIDNDHDGSNNLQEYQNSTNPQNTISCSGSSCILASAPAPDQITFPSIDIVSDKVNSIAGEFNVDSSGAAQYTIPIFTPPGTAGVAPKLALQYRSNGGNGLLGQGWSMGALSAITRCHQTRAQDGQAKPFGYHAGDNSANRFCLDGERLVLVNPAAVYGANGVEYRTEIDGFKKIISYGGDVTTGPDFFRVWHKDGSVSEYGVPIESIAGAPTNANFKPYPSTVTLTWAQNKIEDAVSYTTAMKNPVNYTYEPVVYNSGVPATYIQNEDLRIQKIEYGYGNATIGKIRIEFEYENRPDIHYNHFLNIGLARGHNKRLKTIIVSSRNASNTYDELRTYTLGYLDVTSKSNKTSKLLSLKECRGTTCLPLTQFTWSDKTISYGLVASTNVTGFSTYPFEGEEEGEGPQRFSPADYNGDGFMDLIWIEPDGDDYRFKASPSDGQTLTTAATQSSASHDIKSWTVTDYNQDGFPDILFTSDESLYVYINSNNSGARTYDVAPIMLVEHLDLGTEIVLDGSWTKPEGIFADINADGLIDILYNKTIFYMEKDVSQVNGPYKFGAAHIITLGDPNVSGTLNNKIKVEIAQIDSVEHYKTIDLDSANFSGDFNGDGLPDMVVKLWYKRTSGDLTPWVQRRVVLANDGTGGYKYFDSTAPSYTPAQNNTPFLIEDFNNDGLSDVFFYSLGNVAWYTSLSDGIRLTVSSTIDQYALSYFIEEPSFQDFNSDGLPDLIFRNALSGDDQIWVRLNGGFGNFAPGGNITTIGGSEYGNYTFTDLNGDGISDLVDLYTKAWLGKKPTDGDYNKIIKFENGLGRETNVTYSPLTNNAIYTREFDAPTLNLNYPVFDRFSPIYVVSNVTTSSPTTDANYKRSASYKYQGLKVQPAGWGFLGFHKFSTTENESGAVTTNTYRQDYPFIGSLAGSQTFVSGQTTALSETSYSYAKLSHINGAVTPPHLVVFTQSVDTQRVAESSPTAVTPALTINGLLTVTTTSASNYDSYGNPGTTSVAITGDGVNHITTSTNTYSNTASSWLIGKLTKSVVSQVQGSSTITRTTDFTYSSQTGQLLTEVREPQGANDFKLTTSYQYDGFGNPNRITETSANGTRYSRTEYDSTGRFVDKTYNGLEQLVSEVVQRDIYGSPETISGLNGKIQYSRYGTFGDMYFTAANDGNSATTIKRLCTAVSCPAGAVYRVQAVGSDGSLKNSYADKLGREIRNETKSFSGTLSILDTQYDGAGRVKKVSAPYFSGGTVYWATSDYDHLGRTIKIVDTNNGVSTNAFSRYANGSIIGVKQISKNQLNQTKTTIVNGKNQNIKVLDHLNGDINYTYDAAGNMTQLVSNGVTSTITYDVLGRRTSLNDPDQGAWSYQYNAFGDMTQQTDSLGAKTVMTYDTLGRMSQRQDIKANLALESDTTWTYGTSASARNVGQLTMEQDLISDYIKVYAYDTLGRPSQTVTSLGQDGIEGDYAEYVTYDQYGRIFQQIDATAKGVQYAYNANGYREKLVEAADTSKVYQTITQTNARGQVTSEALMGTQFQVARNYNLQTGLAASILATSSQYAVAPSGSTLLDINLTFDAVGNLTNRVRQVRPTSSLPAKTLTETFGYDGLNRLNGITTVGHAAQSLSYDLSGNILSKTGVGTYTYNSSRPHAVASVGGNPYSYDAIGNMLSGGGRNATYNAFRKPVSVTKGTNTTTFEYAPDRSHYKRVDNNGVNVTKTLTIGNVEIITVDTNPAKTKRYIGGAVVVTDTPTTHEEHVMLTDHLGSTAAVAKATVLELEQQDYDAFGKRRDLWSLNELAQAQVTTLNKLTTKGFTGHEMIDGVGLVHMKGRVYDPSLGRFLSADPFITELDNTQNMNRYSYVYNRPMTMVDPTGFDGEWSPGTTTYGSASSAPKDPCHASFYCDNSDFDDCVNCPFQDGWNVYPDGYDPTAVDGLGGDNDSATTTPNSADIETITVVGNMVRQTAMKSILQILNGIAFGGSSALMRGMMAATAVEDSLLTDMTQKVPEHFKNILASGNIDLQANIKAAEKMSFAELVFLVRPGGNWDYKNSTTTIAALTSAGHYSAQILAEFGNWHFGAAMAANGLGLASTLNGGGMAQAFLQGGAGDSDAITGIFINQMYDDAYARSLTLEGYSWGDNLDDTLPILNGWDWYHATK